MKWIVFACLSLALAWLVVPSVTPEEVAQPHRTWTAPAPSALPSLPTPAIAPVQRAQHLGALACEVIPAQGSHVASTVEEARSAAAEDVRDVCPSNQVTQVLEKCSEQQVPNAEGVLETQYRCVQSGNCRICGDDFARRNEVLAERKT